MALTIPTHFKFKPPNPTLRNHVDSIIIRTAKIIPKGITKYHFSCPGHRPSRIFCSDRSVNIRVSSDDGGEIYVNSEPSSYSDIDATRGSSSSVGDGYVALFVRMLGLDYDLLDREQAAIALWKYALGGKQCVDNIMQFHGCINLTVNLLKSQSESASEAAAGILRMISSVNVYRDLVAESGAVEELASLLRRKSLSTAVKEQGVCTLWNLSVDEKPRIKIANSDIMPLLIKFLEDEDVKVKEAAGGILANLTLSRSNHKIMVEAGVIPKLAKLLVADEEGSKVTRQEAKNALLELAKDEYNRILILEEGLIMVPLVGTAAYQYFRPALHSWPSLPDGTRIEQSSKGPSRYGASELLLGLNIQEKDANLEEMKTNAIVGRTQQQFLARIGAIEMESKSGSSSNERHTLLPVMDGVARLELILGLEDESAISRAAEAIADASINEKMRVSFKEAGAVKHLVQLVNHSSATVRMAALRALNQLSFSNNVCHVIAAEGALHPLINSLKHSETSGKITEMILDILSRILDPGKEMMSKFYDGPVNGSKQGHNSSRSTASAAGTAVTKSSSLPTTHVEDLLDSTVLAHLVETLKISAPELQRKVASILEFVAIIEPRMDRLISVGIESGLDAVFQQNLLRGMKSDIDDQKPELLALEIEEAGHAISAVSRLLTKLLDFDHFCHSIDSNHFIGLLRKILSSDIPLQNKDWVAACLIKLSYLSSPSIDNAINTEVTLYETIPRLIEQIKAPLPSEVQEAAVLELNRIISEGVVDSTRAVAAEGGIFPLVRLIENGSERAVEAGLAILYNLSMDGENHAAIISAGAVPVLRRIVLSQRPQWMRALHLLRTLPT